MHSSHFIFLDIENYTNEVPSLSLQMQPSCVFEGNVQSTQIRITTFPKRMWETRGQKEMEDRTHAGHGFGSVFIICCRFLSSTSKTPQRILHSLRMYTDIGSFHPSAKSLGPYLLKANTDKHVDFRGTGINGRSAAVVALFKHGFQRDQAEQPSCLIVHFRLCGGGQQDIFSSGSL